MKPTKTWHEVEKEWLSDPVFAEEAKKAEEEFRELDERLTARKATDDKTTSQADSKHHHSGN